MSWYCHTIRVEARGVRRVVKHRTSGGGHPVRVNPLFDDHLTHASTHTESLWLTRWATMWIVVALALAYHTLFWGR